MPLELLARFRRLARRQPPPQDTTPGLQHEPSEQQLPIDRKILQDPSSFLDAEVQDALPLGLTPSTRLPAADARSRSRPRPAGLSEDSALPPGSSVDVSPRTPSRLSISRISKIAAGGEWSTFGRKRERRFPDVAGLSGHTPDDVPKRTPSPTRDRKHLSADSVASTFTPSRLTTPSRPSGSMHERHSSPSSRFRQSLDLRFSSKASSPANTMSSKRHPRTPQRPRITSSTTPANRERERALDSPHTFGHLTPPHRPVDFSVACASPAPPLPPLDHPELAAVLCSRRASTSTAQPAFRDRLNTSPTSRYTRIASSSLRLGRPTAMAAQPGRRRRSRTVSEGARARRTSADWSSHQASRQQAWPAEVARAMLQLSLSDARPGSLETRKARTRGRSADPVPRRDRSVMSPSSFLPFPPSRRSSQPPSSASATLPDAIPRSHSLRFDLGHRRGAEQPAKFAMAEVKRSLSVVGARNNGFSGATLGPSSPPPTSSETRQAAPSPQPFSAPTPSRPLLSGRVSPTDTPMSSSLQGEPSTPTPAPRQPSDKSRGKRKAEDNIDLTPPEQRKEGQRATFLLPSQTRSQRVSNSSHAPSSYHRKRARLSSASPFATPAQSRPSSVQETPRSTSRSHHFASLSSGTGARIAPSRTPSRAASTRSRQPLTPSTIRKHERHPSMSQASIPISAFISPHAPSISRSTKFHMRDPHKPPKKPDDTPWGLRLGTEDEPGSPIQAWCFFFGFLLFPIWWIAGLFLHVPATRFAGEVAAEKGVAIDDPQIEHDARTWRFRCRVMTIVSLFTYVPFIVLVAIFVPR